MKNQIQRDQLNRLRKEERAARQLNGELRNQLVQRIREERAAILRYLSGRGPLTRAFDRVRRVIDAQIAELTPEQRFDLVKAVNQWLVTSSAEMVAAVEERDRERPAEVDPAADVPLAKVA